MVSLKKRIIRLTEEMKPVIIKHRRAIHRNPELSGKEEKTSAYVEAVLEANGVEICHDYGEHGVIGIIRGKNSEGATIAIRADMDALPLQEENEVEYASRIKGVMHSCGHDCHTSILLGVASVMSRIKNDFAGNIKLIFQPSEEKQGGGAEQMIENGVMENPAPAAILALHAFPALPVGKIGCKSGVMTASTDGFEITVYGKSGHAARPHQTIDAILVASHLVATLQHIISRRIDPLHPAVITIGTIEGGTAANIVADRVVLSGTIRSLDPCIRDNMPKLMEQVVKGITEAMGAGYDFSFRSGNPSVINDPDLTGLVSRCGREILGPDNVVMLNEPTMGGEDFSLFAEKVPGMFFRLGISNKAKGIVYPLHHKLFDIDEDALSVGVNVLAWSAIRFLRQCDKLKMSNKVKVS